jgi:hypothetical protein
MGILQDIHSNEVECPLDMHLRNCGNFHLQTYSSTVLPTFQGTLDSAAKYNTLRRGLLEVVSSTAKYPSALFRVLKLARSLRSPRHGAAKGSFASALLQDT